MKKNSCASFLLLLFFFNCAYAQSLKECNAIASNANKEYPSRVDSITTIKSVMCYSDNKDIVLIYNMIIDSKGGSSIDQNIINSLRPSMKNTLCTDPDTKLVLRIFPIGYKYFFDNGKYIGELKFSIKECK